jgi:hypothetical protein
MTIFLSNASRSRWVLNIRDPINNKLFMCVLDPGQQERIGRQWNLAQTNTVVDWLLDCVKARDAAEVYSHVDNFQGILYRIENLITSEEIQLGYEEVKTTNQDRSIREATRAALAFDQHARWNEQRNRREPARTTAVEVEQLPTPGTVPNGKEIHFDLTVDPEGRRDVELPR